MKVAVLSVALLFTILLSSTADAKPWEASGALCEGGGIIGGPPLQGVAAGGCMGGIINVHRVKRSEPPVADQVQLLRE